jgi:hypothetical protein
MFDSLSFIISFIVLSFLVLIFWIGIKFFHSIVTAGQSTNTYKEETARHLREDSIEDSQGDGLMLFDDPLFPEELDDDDY